MKVLMLGAAGSIGAPILLLLRESFDVVAADLQPVEGGIVVDAMDMAQLRQAARGCDAIVNFIVADYKDSMHDDLNQAYIDRLMPVNTLTAQHVYEAARLENVPRVVFISSLTVQLGVPHYDVIDPRNPPRPANVYAVSKLCGEQCGELYAHTHGLSVVVLRFGQPAPGQRHDMYLGGDLAKSWSRKGVAISHSDGARAIEAAVRAADVTFAVCNVVSRGTGDQPYIDLTHGEATIGYRPLDTLNTEGYWDYA